MPPATGPVTVWATPDETHAAFQTLRTHRNVALARQPDGDLGARMLAALKASGGPTLVIGTDCPAMMPAHLRKAADVLRGGADAVVCPAEDGGYVLIGMRKPLPALFAGMTWSTDEVMEETRRRLRYHQLTWQEPVTLWDVDVPEDLPRLRGLRPAGRILAVILSSAGSAPARTTIISAAATRGISSGSFRNTTARMVPNSTLVSRSAPTSAIGATVIAQIAMP